MIVHNDCESKYSFILMRKFVGNLLDFKALSYQRIINSLNQM